MNIELRFLQKAIEDKNYISFSYLNKKYAKVEPLELIKKDEVYFLRTKDNIFEFNLIKKLIILKHRV